MPGSAGPRVARRSVGALGKAVGRHASRRLASLRREEEEHWDAGPSTAQLSVAMPRKAMRSWAGLCAAWRRSKRRTLVRFATPSGASPSLAEQHEAEEEEPWCALPRLAVHRLA